jgi:hypothetical protein
MSAAGDAQPGLESAVQVRCSVAMVGIAQAAFRQ